MPPPRQSGVPLARALSKLGLASRSDARALIRDGRVTVDGRVVRDGRVRIDINRAAVNVNGRSAAPVRRLVIALHKPRGVLTSRRDPDGRPTVYELLTDVPERVIPVGRLDLATSGLLLLTNDTALADWLTDPRTAIPRVYLVTVRGAVTDADLDRLRGGIVDAGERLSPAALTLRKTSQRESHLVVTLTEGRNREIRRLFAALDREVSRLRRVQFGGLELGPLAPGAWRVVGDEELGRAFGVMPAAPPRAPDTPPASSRRHSPGRAARTRSAGPR